VVASPYRGSAELVCWSEAAWVAAAAGVGFAVPTVFAGWLGLPREQVVLGYLLVVGPFLHGYARWSGVDVADLVRRNWPFGVLAGAVAGAFVVANVLSQPTSAAPAGLDLVVALLWLGLVYGALDALLLSVLPVFATWRAFAGTGWSEGWPGRLAVGGVALAASALVTASYHLGYPEFRGPAVGAPVVGNSVMSLAYLASANPLSAVIAHVAMHVAGVLQGAETVVQLPPHYR
jgi:hypothetical protein